MPRKKRKDPLDTPIDGRWQGQDTILNPVEGKRYALLDESAAQHAAFRSKGFQRSEKTPGRTDGVAMYDTSSPDDGFYRVGNLVQYEADCTPGSALATAEEHNVQRSDRRLAAIGEAAKGTGGGITVQVRHQPQAGLIRQAR